jgi:hypothetical protein
MFISPGAYKNWATLPQAIRITWLNMALKTSPGASRKSWMMSDGSILQITYTGVHWYHSCGCQWLPYSRWGDCHWFPDRFPDHGIGVLFNQRPRSSLGVTTLNPTYPTLATQRDPQSGYGNWEVKQRFLGICHSWVEIVLKEWVHPSMFLLSMFCFKKVVSHFPQNPAKNKKRLHGPLIGDIPKEPTIAGEINLSSSTQPNYR